MYQDKTEQLGHALNDPKDDSKRNQLPVSSGDKWMQYGKYHPVGYSFTSDWWRGERRISRKYGPSLGRRITPYMAQPGRFA